MRFGVDEIAATAASLGFRPDSLEKVFRLLSLLEALRTNTFLRPRIALKGGTALNLFLFDVPRLSVDIDLNYVGAGERDAMLADKPKIEQAIQAVCVRESLIIKRMPTDAARKRPAERRRDHRVDGDPGSRDPRAGVRCASVHRGRTRVSRSSQRRRRHRAVTPHGRAAAPGKREGAGCGCAACGGRG